LRCELASLETTFPVRWFRGSSLALTPQPPSAG
jgi:hypothetical protein